MTLCAAVQLDDRGILLASDSIVTSSTPDHFAVSISESGNINCIEKSVVGKTSRGEAFQPITTPRGVSFFSESACKISTIGKDAYMAFAGDMEFCVSLSQELTSKACALPLSQIKGWLMSAGTSVVKSQSLSPGHYADTLLAFRTGNGKPRLMKAGFSSTGANAQVSFQPVPPNTLNLIGSGAEVLSSVSTIPSNFYKETSIAKALLQFISWLSRELRKKTRNQAYGAGGAFFGACIDLQNNTSGYMPDALEIVISHAGKIRVLTKTCARPPGYFYVFDFMQRLVNIFPIINELRTFPSSPEAQIKLIRKITNPDMTSIIVQHAVVDMEATDLAAAKGQYVFCDPRGIKGPIGWKTSKSSGQPSKLAIHFGDKIGWLDFPPE